jgi:hypothetical protein
MGDCSQAVFGLSGCAAGFGNSPGGDVAICFVEFADWVDVGAAFVVAAFSHV